MLSFRSYLKEAADPMLELLNGFEFTVKSSDDKMMVVIVAGKDRYQAKQDLEALLTKSNIEFKDGVKSSSSIDIRTTDAMFQDKKYRFLFKPKAGGGSGAGAEVTALGECFQAYACAAREQGGTALDSGEDVFEFWGNRTPKGVEADRTLQQCRELDPGWIHSGVVIANKFHRELGSGNYEFHRGSAMVTAIEKEYNRLKKKEGIRLNINKWNPADIWAVKKGFRFPTKQFATLGDYNSWILEQFHAKELMGVSLKKVPEGTPKREIYNAELKGLDIKFSDFTVVAARKDFFGDGTSKDVYIEYLDHGKMMKMQIRTFSSGLSGWQGEIKGATAAGGKVGGGNLEMAMEMAGIRGFETQSSFKGSAKKPTKAVIKKFATMVKFLTKDRRSIASLEPLCEDLIKRNTVGWFYSKFLSMQFLYLIINSKKQDKVMQNIARIAASSTDVSSVFYKYS